MKKLVLLALASAATFVLPAVVMAQEVKPPEVNISGVHLNHEENQIVQYMSDDEFYKFKQTYELSNGNTLSLFSRFNNKYAKLGDGTWHRIVATGPNSFVSKDHQLKMEINLQNDDKVSGYLLMPAASPAVAGNDVTSVAYVKVVFR
ncbi:hypothetical protein S2091_1895 [Solimicrobium silvestre]|uniref:Uncharacterized protein n=2 Tax=Solimicrobium silvestre TaxID=2099400 RepID=A0A2S9H0L9_9BURK|nr:hypothetical protein S2091_1895 [Solimicrobium silvestre]